MWENQNREVTVMLFHLARQCHWSHYFLYFLQCINFSLHLVERDTDPDPDRQALDANPDLGILQNDADPTGSGSTTL